MTTITMNVPDTMSVHIAKIGRTITFDSAKMSAAGWSHLLDYGVTQNLADSIASAECADKAAAKLAKRKAMFTEAEKDSAEAMVLKRLDNLISGSIRAARQSDPVAKRARELALVKINEKVAAAVTAGRVAKEDETSTVKAKAVEFFADATRMSPFLAQARIDIDAANALDIGDLDI